MFTLKNAVFGFQGSSKTKKTTGHGKVSEKSIEYKGNGSVDIGIKLGLVIDGASKSSHVAENDPSSAASYVTEQEFSFKGETPILGLIKELVK